MIRQLEELGLDLVRNLRDAEEERRVGREDLRKSDLRRDVFSEGYVSKTVESRLDGREDPTEGDLRTGDCL